MNLNSMPPIRRRTRATLIALFALLTLCEITFATHAHNKRASPQSTSFDEEEVTLETRHDYERTSVDHRAPQITHEAPTITSLPGAAADQRQSTVRISDYNDPFALTFEDYLREASKSTAHQIAADVDDSTFSSSAVPGSVGLIIEDEEDSAKPKESPIIDYIFPPSKQESNQHHIKHNAKQTDRHLDNNNNSNNKDPNQSELLNEIRLLFAWKRVPTNKCSKTCGKGYRVNHLSCVDLKYDVRVEDELCQKSNISKPNEISDDPCNEIDCPPQWTSVEFQECNPVASQDGVCQANLFKRVQCTMINKSGQSIYLDDSKCNSTKSTSGTSNQINVTQISNAASDESRSRARVLEDENMDISIDTPLESDEKNDILSNIDAGGGVESILQGFSSSNKGGHPHNEPFYEAEPWSECSGASCGQLGKRSRKLSCRLYLSRSSKFAELPESSCHNAPMPDTQEPCYMDCVPEVASNNRTSSGAKSNIVEYNDETVYDLEMTRFVWRIGGWTKCSVECLGGRRESILECWDKVAEAPVESSLCDKEMKPQTVIEICNDIPCQPEWRIESFSKCNKPCGSAGNRTRSIACVQQVPSQEGPRYLIVSNDLCIQTNGVTPHKIESCNRFDCRPEWSVGPWSQCSGKCGEGFRNRTVICVQEFADRDGPKVELDHKHGNKRPNPEIAEAVAISAQGWYAGKVTQVPTRECYDEYKTIPAISESCSNFCEEEPYIDADTQQNYRMTQESMRKRTVTLKVGGKAKVMRGKNLKIRCRLINRPIPESLVKSVSDMVEWRKDGIKIFPNGSTMVDKQYAQDDNSILGNVDQFMADDPNSRKADHPSTPTAQQRPRTLRSSNNYSASHSDQQGNYTFVSQAKGRFSLVKENTLRIKRLQVDDSGSYTCSYGSISASLELTVASRQDHLSSDDRELANSLGV